MVAPLPRGNTFIKQEDLQQAFTEMTSELLKKLKLQLPDKDVLDKLSQDLPGKIAEMQTKIPDSVRKKVEDLLPDRFRELFGKVAEKVDIIADRQKSEQQKRAAGSASSSSA